MSTIPDLVGRQDELQRIRAALKARRNLLIEGPVGVGKTHLALAVAHELGRPVFRVDGDSRYSEQKLSGWFDPPSVIQKGFVADTFMAGPLVEAMRKGGMLFINELNRLPEGVQNILLPAIDERMISIPRLGEVRAGDAFLVIATQNPKEFVATSHLSEAILDRFELVILDYQSESEEVAIVNSKVQERGHGAASADLVKAAVSLVRMTRNHSRIRRGASVRAAISTTEIAAVLMEEGLSLEDAFLKAVLMALPTRIEFEREAQPGLSPRSEIEGLLTEWAAKALGEASHTHLKKKP